MKNTLNIGMVLFTCLLLFLSTIIIYPSVPAPDGNPNYYPPVANAGGPYSGEINESIVFDASGSYDQMGAITGYRWDWTNDGSWDTGWLTSPQTQHSYSTAGSYIVKLQVKDNGDEYGDDVKMGEDTASVTVTVPQPKADFLFTPSTPTDLEVVTFTDRSAVNHDSIVSWTWSFGDGTSSSQRNPSHQFMDDGVYKVSLTVEGSLGGSATVTKNLNVMNIPPVAVIDEITPNPVSTYKPALFRGSGEDSDGQIIRYQWNSDIDGILYNDSDSSFTQTNLTIGEHLISLRVLDNDDIWSDWVNTTLQVLENQAPEQPTITGTSNGKAGRDYDYSFLATDPEEDQVYYIIDWGDNTTIITGLNESGVEIIISHMWNTKGSYNVSIKAIDEYGAESNWTTLPVTMPCSYDKSIPQFFDWLFQRFSHAFPLLRHLVED